MNEEVGTIDKFLPDVSLHNGDGPAMLLGTQAGLGWLPRLASFWASRSDNIKSPLLAVSFEVGGGENVPGIPGACATPNLRIW